MKSILENGKQLNYTQPETQVEKNPLKLAASWYIAMPSKELGKKPKAIQLFGRDLVAWRDGKGNPVIMERYCSHMGASLAIGEVKDGCIQCPFHHWHYDNKGNCVSIPDIEHIPPTARQATYVTQERYSFIWVWYGTSEPLFPLPEIPAAEGEKYNYMPYYFAFNTKTTVRRTIENTVDLYHDITLHKMPKNIQIRLLDKQESSPEFQALVEKSAWFGSVTSATMDRDRGIVAAIHAIRQLFGAKKPRWVAKVDSWTSGFVVNLCVSDKETFIYLVATTPIAETETIRHGLMMLKKTGFFLTDLIFYVIFGLRREAGIPEDLSVWSTMKPDGGGAYVKHDEEVLKFRQFYQLWVDKVEI